VLYRFLLLAALSAVASVNAQTAYRWIDPATGKTVYSDQPPPSGAKSPATLPNGRQKPEGESSPGWNSLPYAIRIASEKYPVTLYTAAHCGDFCDQARALLAERRIPYTEIVLDKLPEDELKKNLKKLGSETPFLPILTVGSQRKDGIEKSAWNDLFNLAGFPQDVSGVKPPAPVIVPPTPSAPSS
jgi:glutaredoxin